MVTITETIARAMHTALMSFKGIPLEHCQEGAARVLTALTEAGYTIVPVEPTDSMAKVGIHVAQTGAVLGAWEAMIAAAPDHIMVAIQSVGPLDSEERE